MLHNSSQLWYQVRDQEILSQTESTLLVFWSWADGMLLFSSYLFLLKATSVPETLKKNVHSKNYYNTKAEYFAF